MGERVSNNLKDVICKHRNKDEKKRILSRLNIISGQLKGIANMVEDNRSCEEIFGQLASAENALKSLGVAMLKSHLGSTIYKGEENIDLDSMDEVFYLLKKLNI